jgi:hypothetical protein
MARIRVHDTTAYAGIHMRAGEVYEVSDADAAHLIEVAGVAGKAAEGAKTYSEKQREAEEERAEEIRLAQEQIQEQIEHYGERLGDVATVPDVWQERLKPLNRTATHEEVRAADRGVIGPPDPDDDRRRADESRRGPGRPRNVER